MVYSVMRSDVRQRVERARRKRFESVVRDALRSLPAPVVAMLDNVAVVVEDEPRPGMHPVEGRPDDQDDQNDLFGYYEGTPLTDRTSAYGLQTPDRIVIFRKPLERAFPEPATLRDEVKLTIIHELAHHVGYDEDEISARGWE